MFVIFRHVNDCINELWKSLAFSRSCYGNCSLFLVVVCIRDDRTKLLPSVGLAPIRLLKLNSALSTIVRNSGDWSEIIWLPKFLHFKNQPCNRLYPKKPAGMHWLGYNV